ncbi:unnamed protein product [Caenorhabditis bovis]|uniref:Uncharacterized protein n=1 Tax=Caenorhabditis bovis TaxID=2654633 RepID=A0A8S1EZA2_9PELO|nr:unnamed protein product [Caenorhabditis bovis]
MLMCSKKKTYDGNRDVSLVIDQKADEVMKPPISPASSTPTTGTPKKDDAFSVGTPLPNVPLADPPEDNDNTLQDIESIQSEKAMLKKKEKAMKEKKPR